MRAIVAMRPAACNPSRARWSGHPSRAGGRLPAIVTADLSAAPALVLRGVRQHNLRNITVRFPRGRLTVVTGLSGSGKSSLVFDTLYAEGQRRYTESVSAYARQFLERIARPDLDGLEGICPAIAIGRSDPPRTARSTVGTVTEVADALRLLWARAGTTICPECGREVEADSPESVADRLLAAPRAETAALVTYAPEWNAGAPLGELASRLLAQGFLRFFADGALHRADEPDALPASAARVDVVVDRVMLLPSERSRLVDALELAFRAGHGVAAVRVGDEILPVSDRAACAPCGRTFTPPSPLLFSFNAPLGACPECRGFGDVLEFDLQRIVPDSRRSLRENAIAPWAGSWRGHYMGELTQLAKNLGVSLDTPWEELPAAVQTIVLHGDSRFEGVLPFLETIRQESYKPGSRFLVKRYQSAVTCRSCGGARLAPDALAVRVGGRTIAQATAWQVRDLRDFLAGLDLEGARAAIATPILDEALARLDYLEEVGLPYLTLDRPARTLSGGEMQRIGMARALGAHLTDTLYVLDEPTIGLHARDAARLLEVIEQLVDRGNTVVVVEHDRGVLERADWVIDLGPGAGARGGEVVAEGTPEEVRAHPTSLTAAYVRGDLRVTRRGPRRATGAARLGVRGATLHNLRGVDVDLPLGAFVCITGVSGSGKSTLLRDIVAPRLARGEDEPSDAADDDATPADQGRAQLLGSDTVRELIVVDQSPIGRSPRSNPATFCGAYTDIRALYGAEPEARRRGLTAGSFSFNIAGGRCETCEGEGIERVEMYWLADVTVECSACGGTKFRPEALGVLHQGRSIHEVLAMTVDEAVSFFARVPKLAKKLWVLQRVGLGYLTLGQSSTTLSGGEAQRLKIARNLIEGGKPGALYLLDEPTVGLHAADVQKLLDLLHELVAERGATVWVIEHNLDVIWAADWVIDMGPEGGEGGGRVVAQGTPETVAAAAAVSYTGAALAAARAEGSLVPPPQFEPPRATAQHTGGTRAKKSAPRRRA